MFRKAIERKLGVKRRRRFPKPKYDIEKFRRVVILLHPKVIRWAKAQAKKRHVDYQIFINDTLFRQAA